MIERTNSPASISDAALPVALAFRDVVLRATAQNFLTIRESGDDLLRSAFAVLARHADLRLSYADAVGAVIAREPRVDAVYGLDNDFRLMGLTLEQ